MSIRCILVNLDIDGSVVTVVKAARDIATHFRARLIGFCAADATMPLAIPEGGAIGAEIWQQMRDGIQSRFKVIRADFERLTANAGETEWREVLDYPTRALAEISRAADLVIMSAPDGASTGDTYRTADPGSIVLQAGRPVLVLAQGASRIPAGTAVVAWKDTREARRAVANAVPLLAGAGEVIVVCVASEIDPWLREGVTEGRRLAEFIGACEADLVVSGAYGHSRFREWAFGGVTRSLLDETWFNRFMSS